MKKKIIAVSVLIVATLFVCAIAGTIFYYNGVVNDKNSKIASLNNEIANLNSQISNLKGQLTNLTGQTTNLTSAYLVTALGVAEVPFNSPDNMPTPLLYNHLYIEGSVTNTGETTAYNAGLHVDAYAANGTLLINMTVFLGDGTFGTDPSTDIYGVGGTQLGSLGSGQTATIDLSIFHEGTAINWNVTAVWTNSP